MTAKRSAEDTIKGFNYQFAATVLLLLAASSDGEVVVEGIEDIDVTSDSITAAVQCKYYEGTKLTNSVLREIVKPMLEDDKSRIQKIIYYVYGHFKDQSDLPSFPLTDPAAFRNDVLCYKIGKGAQQIQGNIADDTGLTDAEIADFISRLRFTYTDNYESHKRSVEAALKKQFSCAEAEVSYFYYPLAFSKIAELATKGTDAERTIKKSEFLEAFRAKQIVFKHWLLHDVGEQAFCLAMRRKFFSFGNVSPSARFFVIECIGDEVHVELKSLALCLRDKWSSHKKTSRLAVKDRYSPYLLLRNLVENSIAELLREFHQEQIRFVDGFPFKGSKFSVAHISQQQTVENGISLRLLYETAELELMLASLPHQTKEIYEFYRTSTLPLAKQIPHVQIPVLRVAAINEVV